ncbi:FeMo cofactor biosynthesis protein NifB [Oxobacter pfennigii]|uniref:FeMo cofactor biosynthesis protein NifB n=1 Tax=Oxobacter pfennigii TaxID=36849 RepID=A0A0P8WU16_9CLOT|nr:NifB/NifX family molybdenum-iron cluster-binding protein [Oxobacter pfennigii]KPU46179.1 FeMo cofactor biosynthesis protein NifB [Oxobacter pfennigii]
MGGKWRVAVASTDGKVINEHFGRAKDFFIIDIKSDGSREYIERRIVTPLCANGEHKNEELSYVINALSDCTAVLVARVGMGVKRALEINKISVFEQPDYIENALTKLTNYFIKTNHSYMEEK